MDKELLSNMKAEEEIIAGPSTSLVASNNLDDLNRKVLSNHLILSKIMSHCGPKELVVATWVCQEWAKEARKFLHENNSDGILVRMNGWIESLFHLDDHPARTENRVELIKISDQEQGPIRPGPLISAIQDVDERRAMMLNKIGWTELAKYCPELESIHDIMSEWVSGGQELSNTMGEIFDGTTKLAKVTNLSIHIQGVSLKHAHFVRISEVEHCEPNHIHAAEVVAIATRFLDTFPALENLHIECMLLPVLVAILRGAGAGIESIQIFTAICTLGLDEIAQFPLLLPNTPRSKQLPLTKMQLECSSNSPVDLQSALNLIPRVGASDTLRELLLFYMIGDGRMSQVDVVFPVLSKLKCLTFIQWPSSCHPLLMPKVQRDKDGVPVNSFPALKILFFDGVACRRTLGSVLCYNLTSTLIMLQRLFPTPSQSMRSLPLFTGYFEKEDNEDPEREIAWESHAVSQNHVERESNLHWIFGHDHHANNAVMLERLQGFKEAVLLLCPHLEEKERYRLLNL